MKKAVLVVLAVLFGMQSVAYAHHGVVVLGATGPEGPGAPIETTGSLPLPEGGMFFLLRNEYVPWQQKDFADPENKKYSDFAALAMGYGITPYLSTFLSLPYNTKSQDNIGTDRNIGDPNLMLSLAFKYDDGFKLVPRSESLDELADWHFGICVGSTIPLGKANTTKKDENGDYFAPDMQIGFGKPAPGIVISAQKQLTDNLTFLADVQYQYFFKHRYPWGDESTTYQFGAETRVDTALTYKVYGKGHFRADLSGELNYLNLQRDREKNNHGDLVKLSASGGDILYATIGTRLIYDRWSLAIGIKKAIAKALNESGDQQGSEGLEEYRLITAISRSF